MLGTVPLIKLVQLLHNIDLEQEKLAAEKQMIVDELNRRFPNAIVTEPNTSTFKEDLQENSTNSREDIKHL